jgi:hypothetical protein
MLFLHLKLVLFFFKFAYFAEKFPYVNVPDSSLVEDFSRLINNPQWSDVTIIVDNATFFAHKGILNFRIEQFSERFLGGHIENREIVLKEVSIKQMEQFLKIVYTGECTNRF